MTEFLPAKEPTVYRGREHSEVEIPLEAMLKAGRLDIFDEVKGKNYFQIYSKGADLVFQCGGFVGLIPINEEVAIEVAPRVSISNLDRILRQASAPHKIFTLINRSYAASQETSYLIDLLADALVAGVEEIVEWGKHKEYARKIYSGHPRSGRILIKETSRLRAKNPGTVSASTARFERDSRNVFNTCIRFALEQLIRTLSAEAAQRHLQRLSRLNLAWQNFPEVRVSGDAKQIAAEVERRAARERLSPPYVRTLPLANAVLRGFGPSQRNLPPSFSLGSLIFDVADAFEKYVRASLSEHLKATVLDGNQAGPGGAKRLLFPGSTNVLTRNVHTTPDILVLSEDNATSVCVLDVKYKPYSGMPDRNDINQALAYAIAYGTSCCGLVYPANTHTGRVDDFGSTGGVRFLGFSIGLNAPDLQTEERRFATDFGNALGIALNS